MTFYERSELFRKYPKTPVFNHLNYQLFERIHAVPGTSNNRGLTVVSIKIPFKEIHHLQSLENLCFLLPPLILSLYIGCCSDQNFNKSIIVF